MKRTQFLDARRNVRREIVAFFSIVVIGMLAVVAYLSVTYSAFTLKKDALHFFNANELWDLETASTLLMDEEDLEAIRAIPGVKAADRVYQVETSLHSGDHALKVSVLSLPQEVSRPVLLEGRLPEKAEECAVERKLLEDAGLAVGDSFTLEDVQLAGIAPLAERSFVITGVFQTPDHITYMIPITPYVFVTEDAFDRGALDGAFMKARVRVDNAPEDRYSEAYWQTVAPVAEALEAMGAQRGPARLERLRGSYEEQLREGQEKLDEAAEQLRQGRETIEAGRRELEEAAEKLKLGKELLDYGGEELYYAHTQIAEGAEMLSRFQRLLDYVRALLDRGEDWLRENIDRVDWPEEIGVTREEFLQAVGKGKEYAMAWLYDKSGYTENRTLLSEVIEIYRNSRDDWYFRGEEYLDALTRLERGWKQLEEGERELREGQERYDAAEAEMDEAREALDKLTECRWVTINVRGNAGYIYARENVRKLSSLSMTFSSIFLIVGALVIYATIGRMVEQHGKLIGAMKALGLYNREVFAKYLFFACSAVLLGSLFGILLSYLPLQRAVLRPYEALFTYGTGTRSFLPLNTALVVAGAFLISLFAVYLGCGRLLRMPAIRLMQGNVSAAGRKKARRSAKRSVYSRLILRNMRTDWARVLVTVVSIAGGCMLMVIGFTLRYGISAVTGRQFGHIMTYEADVFYSTENNADADAQIAALLEESGLAYTGVRKMSGLFDSEGTYNAMTMIVADKGELEGFYTLRDIENGEPIEPSDGGALVPRRFAEYYGRGVGDAVQVYWDDLKLRDLPVTGVFENYFGQIFFLTPQGYESVFESEAKDNCFLVRLGGMSFEELRDRLAGVEGLVEVNDAAADRVILDRLSGSLSFVVWFMLFIAGMMSCFIVANFTMTFIQRKTRELTIMRINGFSTGECIRYVAVDLALTTLLGILLGLVLGGIVGRQILLLTEAPYIQMAREPFLRTYLFSSLITCGFSLLTNGYALQRVRKLKLSDMN